MANSGTIGFKIKSKLYASIQSPPQAHPSLSFHSHHLLLLRPHLTYPLAGPNRTFYGDRNVLHPCCSMQKLPAICSTEHLICATGHCAEQHGTRARVRTPEDKDGPRLKLTTMPFTLSSLTCYHHVFIHSTNILAYYVPGTILGTGEATVNKKTNIPVFKNLMFQWGSVGQWLKARTLEPESLSSDSDSTANHLCVPWKLFNFSMPQFFNL